jgi:hypothetical protein
LKILQTIFAFLILANAGLAYSQEAKPVAATSAFREVQYQAFRHEDFLKGNPVVDSLFDGQNRLWILNGSGLWFLELLNKQLVRIRIDAAKDKISAISRHNNIVYATDGTSVFAIKEDSPTSIRQISLSEPLIEAKKMIANRDAIYVLSAESMRKIFPTKGTSEVLPIASSGLLSSSRYATIIDGFHWNFVGGKLSVTDMTSKSVVRTIEIEKFLSIDLTQGHVVVTSSSRVFQYSPAGDLVHEVVVDGKTPLIGSAHCDHIHSYMFKSGILERYDNLNETRRIYNFGATVAAGFPRIRCRSVLVGLGSAEDFRVFHLQDTD